MITPAGGDEGGGSSWAIVLGIAIVAEVALLWIAACLGLWRRRLVAGQAARAAAGAQGGGGAADDGRLPRPLAAALRPATAVLRRIRNRPGS